MTSFIVNLKRLSKLWPSSKAAAAAMTLVPVRPSRCLLNVSSLRNRDGRRTSGSFQLLSRKTPRVSRPSSCATSENHRLRPLCASHYSCFPPPPPMPPIRGRTLPPDGSRLLFVSRSVCGQVESEAGRRHTHSHTFLLIQLEQRRVRAGVRGSESGGWGGEARSRDKPWHTAL